MSWHYLQEQGGVFSLHNYLASIPLQHAKLNPAPVPSSSPDSATASSPTSPSGTTSAPSTAHPSEATSTSSQADFPVRTSQPQEKEQASPAPAPASGLKCTESFAKYDPATHTWKTPQCSLLEDLDEYSETWPKSGIMLHGSCWELPTAALPTSETASGFSLGMLPTPIAHNAQEMGCPSDQRRKSPGLGTMAATGQLGTPGALNPTWVEWLMGWPLGWTDCEPLATDKYLLWLQQHSKSLNKD